MATKVVMEALSPTMEEGRLVKWSKNEGDQIKSGDVLAEVETDKAVMELVARGDGVLRKRIANEGDASPVGTLLAVIAGPDENIDSIVGSAAPAGAAAASKGDTGTQSPPANKTVAETKETANASAVPQTPAQSQGEASTPPQQKTSSAASAPPARPAAPRPPSPPPAPRGNGSSRSSAPQTGGRQRSSPLARRLSSERGIQLGGIQGTGPAGRILKRDIENAKASGGGAGRSAAAERLATEGDFKDVALTQIRKTIAR